MAEGQTAAPEIKVGQDLLPVVRQLEDSGDDARSARGAVGRYQIMPGTARSYGFDPAKLTDPAYNEQVAATVLNDLWHRYRGNTTDVLAAYNAGSPTTNRWIAGGRKDTLPPETANYLQRASTLVNQGGAPLQAPTSGNGDASAPSSQDSAPVPPGRAAMQARLDAGFSNDEVLAWKDQKTKDAIAAGFKPQEIESYWGDAAPPTGPIDTHVQQNLSKVGQANVPKVAQSPLDMLAAGWDMSVSGLQINQRLPQTVLGPNAGAGAKTLQGIGQTVGDFPEIMIGMGMGAPLGAAAATGASGPEMAPVGATIGGMFGAGALPQAMRETMIDSYRRGEIHSASDFLQMAGGSLWRTAKAGLVNAAAGPVGSKAAGVVAPAIESVAGPMVSNMVTTSANVAAQAATMTTLDAGFSGRLPDAGDFASAAVLMAGMHVAGAVVGTRENPRIELNEAGQSLKGNLEELYKQTGIPPWLAVKAAREDPALMDELMARDTKGEPVFTKFRQLMNEPESFQAAPKTELVPPGGEGGKPPGGGPEITPPEPGPRKVEPGQQFDEKTLNEIANEFIGEPKRTDAMLDPAYHYRQWISELGPFRDIDKMLADHGFDLKHSLGLEDMARQTYASPSRTGYFVRKGGLDALTFEGTKAPPVEAAVKLAKDNGGNLNDWINYMVAKRAISKGEQGIETGHPLDMGQLKTLVAFGDKKYAAATDSLQRTFDSVLDYGRDSGVFSQTQIDAMRRDNPIYISYRRLMGDEETMPVPKGARRGFKVREPVERFEGDDRRIMNPLIAAIDNIEQIVRMSDRNRLTGSVVTLAEQHGLTSGLGLKQLSAREAPAPYATVAEPGSNTFKPYDVTDTKPYEPFLAVKASRFGGLRETQFIYLRDGKMEVWEAASPELASAIRGADTLGQADIVTRTFQKFAAVQRTGIVSAIDFPARITLRHQITAFIADPTSPPPFVTWLRGAFDAFKGGDAYWNFVGKGGAGTALIELDRDVVQKDMQRIFAETGTWTSMWNTVAHPIEAAQMIFELSQKYSERMDAAARIGFGKNAEEQGFTAIKAATMGRKAMLDYSEKATGVVAQWMARTVPFFRPRLLGLKQFGEVAGNGLFSEEVGSAAYKAMLAVTLPTVALNIINYFQDKYGGLPEDRKFSNLTRYVKDGSYVFPEVGGVRIRLPYPFVVGVPFGGFVTRFMDHFAANDPKAFEDWGSALLAEIVPPVIPAALGPVADQVANKHLNLGWFEQHKLVPASMEQASGPMQYTENTTETAKALGRTLGKIGVDASPIVMENYVREWSGSLGMAAMKALSIPFTTSGKPWTVEDTPFVQSFLIRNPGMNAQPVRDFFTELGELQSFAADKRLAMKRAGVGADNEAELDQAMQNFLDTRGPENTRNAILMQANIVEGINNDKTMTREEKLRATDIAYSNMITTAKFGLEAVRSMRAAQKAP